MTDLFDQYVSTERSSRKSILGDVPLEPISSGFVTVTNEETKPMFQAEKFNFRAQSKVKDVAVSNNIMVIALEGCQVKRIELSNPFEVDTVIISKRTDDQIDKIFLDITGCHLLISMKSSDTLYLGKNNKKPRLLQKLKSYKVESIAWNKFNMTEITTGQILIGTNKGQLCETEIDSEEKFLSMGSERNLKVIFNVNEKDRDVEEALTGIHMEKMADFENRYVVILTTPSRFYQFVGDASGEIPIFQNVLSVYNPDPTPYLELPGMLGYSNLAFYYMKAKGMPKYFAWLTGPGVYFGELDFYRTELKSNITKNSRLLLPTEGKSDPPVSIAISEFHCILLYENKIESICILNDEEDFSDVIAPRYGTMIALRTDILQKTLWAFSESTIFQYHIHQESKNVWKLHLNRKEFELAKEYCKNNKAQMDLVLRMQAESLFNEGKYLQAASCYALTLISFEEVVLKFLDINDTEPLKIFLQKKIINLKSADKTQLTMLVTWLIEIYLNQLGQLRDKGLSTDYEVVQDDFRKFINQSRIKSCLEQNKNVAYDLLSSHGDTENMIFFAMLMKDFRRVIQHRIQQDNYLAALDVLKKQTEDNQQYQSDLFEQFSPTLMQHIPKPLVEVWKQRDLDPKKLIPALVTQTQTNNSKSLAYAVDYLEHCVYKLNNQEKAIHNYLISLYCKMGDEAPLLRYLNGQNEDIDGVCYEPKYALRLCSENNKHQAAVQIYSAMGLFEEAVDLALKVDIEKAKLYADKPEDDDLLKKKLWLKIARHVVDQQQDIGKAMELLKDCQLLKIEDILPFFPDFVTIDHFKDAICDSLQEYNKHIDRLKQAMEEATESAKVVRAEIQDIRNRYGTIAGQEKCAVCYYPLVTRSFYYFPCTHVFHADCLIEQVKIHTKERVRIKIDSLQSKVAALSSASNNSASSSVTLEKMRLELDELIASECLYCGDIMVRTLDEPFIPPGDFEAVLQSWS